MGISNLSPAGRGDVDLPRALSRNNSGRILFVEDFRIPGNSGMWNDGVGSAARDTDITFGGLPSLRLDPQGNSSGSANPGRTANILGVVVKRRVHDGFTGRFGMEAWFRFTSKNLTSNSFLAMSVYNRDGANAFHGRVWLDPNGNNFPLVGRILDGAATATANGATPTAPGGAATYTAVATSVLQNGAGSHTFDPVTGSMDKVGGWHYVKLVVDMAAKKYVSLTLDGQPVTDLSAYSMDNVTSPGFAGMHFSFEYFASTTTRPRYINVAQVIGTVE